MEKLKIRKDDEGYYRWTCPCCKGTYTYSRRINAQWGHPEDKLVCAVCNKIYDIDKE